MSLIAASSGIATLVSTLAAEGGGEVHRELPMPAYAYGLIAFALFLLCLALTWSFRNTAAKISGRHHAPEGPHDPGHEHRFADPVGGSHN